MSLGCDVTGRCHVTGRFLGRVGGRSRPVPWHRVLDPPPSTTSNRPGARHGRGARRAAARSRDAAPLPRPPRPGTGVTEPGGPRRDPRDGRAHRGDPRPFPARQGGGHRPGPAGAAARRAAARAVRGPLHEHPHHVRPHCRRRRAGGRGAGGRDPLRPGSLLPPAGRARPRLRLLLRRATRHAHGLPGRAHGPHGGQRVLRGRAAGHHLPVG